MRRTISSVTTPGRWRRRRVARIALAGALVVAAPIVDRPADQGAGHPDGGAVSTAGPGPDTGHARARVVPVPLADPAVADLLRPGDLVDLIATADVPTGGSTPGAAPALVAHAARVRDAPEGRGGGRSLLVEVPEVDAARLAAMAAVTPLAVVVHG